MFVYVGMKVFSGLCLTVHSKVVGMKEGRGTDYADVLEWRTCDGVVP